MVNTLAQNNNYNPRVLEEHVVGNGFDHKKRAIAFGIVLLIVIGLIAWYVVSNRTVEMTPEATLKNLSERSAPVTTTAAERVQEGKVLENSNSKKTTSTSEQRLHTLNSLNH